MCQSSRLATLNCLAHQTLECHENIVRLFFLIWYNLSHELTKFNTSQKPQMIYRCLKSVNNWMYHRQTGKIPPKDASSPKRINWALENVSAAGIRQNNNFCFITQSCEDSLVCALVFLSLIAPDMETSKKNKSKLVWTSKEKLEEKFTYQSHVSFFRTKSNQSLLD